MVCIDLDDVDNTLNVSSFVRMYQESSGLLIACLEEISFRKGLISAEDLSRICQNAPYRNKLLQALEIKR